MAISSHSEVRASNTLSEPETDVKFPFVQREIGVIGRERP